MARISFLNLNRANMVGKKYTAIPSITPMVRNNHTTTSLIAPPSPIKVSLYPIVATLLQTIGQVKAKMEVLMVAINYPFCLRICSTLSFMDFISSRISFNKMIISSAWSLSMLIPPHVSTARLLQVYIQVKAKMEAIIGAFSEVNRWRLCLAPYSCRRRSPLEYRFLISE